MNIEYKPKTPCIICSIILFIAIVVATLPTITTINSYLNPFHDDYFRLIISYLFLFAVSFGLAYVNKLILYSTMFIDEPYIHGLSIRRVIPYTKYNHNNWDFENQRELILEMLYYLSDRKKQEEDEYLNCWSSYLSHKRDYNNSSLTDMNSGVIRLLMIFGFFIIQVIILALLFSIIDFQHYNKVLTICLIIVISFVLGVFLHKTRHYYWPGPNSREDFLKKYSHLCSENNLITSEDACVFELTKKLADYYEDAADIAEHQRTYRTIIITVMITLLIILFIIYKLCVNFVA